MRIEETYNIHKKISCIFPHFKSKWLCKKGKHNYQLMALKPNYIAKWKCYCCGKEIDLEKEVE